MKQKIALLVVFACLISPLLSACNIGQGVDFAELDAGYQITIPVRGCVGYKDTLFDETKLYSNFQSDEDGRLISWEDGRRNIYSRKYDSAGRIILEKKNDDETTTYRYDASGNMVNRLETASNNNYRRNTDCSYDADGFLVSTTTDKSSTFIDGEHWVTEYRYKVDSLGRIVEENVDDNYLFQYEYDELNRITKQTELYYESNGNLLSKYCVTFSYAPSGCIARKNIQCEYEKDGGGKQWEIDFYSGRIGSKTISAEKNDMLNDPEDWIAYDAAKALPALDSVIKGVTVNQSNQEKLFRYSIEEKSADAKKGFNSVPHYDVAPDSYFKQSDALTVLDIYIAVVSQVLGYEAEKQPSESVLISRDEKPLAKISYSVSRKVGSITVELI